MNFTQTREKLIKKPITKIILQCNNCNKKHIIQHNDDLEQYKNTQNNVKCCNHTAAICRECKEPTEELHGLFVPYACQTCLTKIRNKCINDNDICTLCRKPQCDCYC